MLTADTAKNLLNGKTEVSLDLGLTTARVNRTKNGVELNPRENIDYVSLEKIAEKEKLEDEVNRIRKAREVLKKWVESRNNNKESKVSMLRLSL